MQSCEIAKNGDCLFAAVAHQMFNVKLNSLEHKKMSDDLRKAAVNHIPSNFHSFKHDVKNRVLNENNGRVAPADMEKMCLNFVKRLSQNGIWGGTESIKAITAIYQVNILVIQNDGSSYLGSRYSPNAKRSLMVTYKNNDHYDSVSNVVEAMLERFCEMAIESERKWISFQNDIINCDQIVYEIE